MVDSVPVAGIQANKPLAYGVIYTGQVVRGPGLVCGAREGKPGVTLAPSPIPPCLGDPAS